MPVSSARTQWQTFWWGPADPRLLSSLRIAFACVAIGVHGSWWPEIEPLLDARSSARLVFAPEAGRGLSLFSLGAVTGATAQWVHGLTLAPLVALLFGLGGRWMALLSWLVVLGWYQRLPGSSTGGDRLLRFALLYLSVGHCTAVWSVDAWLARRKGQRSPAQVPMLPIRLIQVQWAGMYLISGLEKAAGSTWRDGTAIHYALSNRAFARLGPLVDPVLATEVGAVVLQLSTWVVLAWELAFPLAMFGCRARRFALLLGVAIHIGIGLTMSIGPFTVVTLVGYLAFCNRPGVTSTALQRLGVLLQAIALQSSPADAESLPSPPPADFQETP
ncbi:MAG TPA: hypothetical protein DFR83_22815 [Deltaproteobacteria bacterium]|nr:hypothetical protein [Deltaproteobacteria bacterium]